MSEIYSGIFVFVDDSSANRQSITDVLNRLSIPVKEFAEYLSKEDYDTIRQWSRDEDICGFIMANYGETALLFKTILGARADAVIIIFCDNWIGDNEYAGEEFISENVENYPTVKFVIISGAPLESKQSLQQFPNFVSDFPRTTDWDSQLENTIKRFQKTGKIEVTEGLLGPLSNFKHRIAHCFLSIDVDLQGISAIWSENKAETEKYLAGVLWGEEGESPKRSGYYVGKLEEARGLTGLEENEPDTIQKIVQDKNLQNNEWWKRVKDLLGDDKANDKANSPVYPLLKSLDDLLDEGRNKCRNEQLALLDDSRIQLFIEYFGNLQKCWDEQAEKNIEWGFDECFEKLISKKDKYSFHDWFTTLDEALDKLRGDLPA